MDENQKDAEAALPKAVEQLHEEACDLGKDTYVDPDTGRMVFTRIHHLKRGECCGSGCRHCPYPKDGAKSS